MFDFIIPACTFIIKRGSCHSSFPVRYEEIFKTNFLLEHPCTSASDFIFDIFMKEIHESQFSTCLFYRKKQSKKVEWFLVYLVGFGFARKSRGCYRKKEEPTRKLYETFITVFKKLYKSFTKRLQKRFIMVYGSYIKAL